MNAPISLVDRLGNLFGLKKDKPEIKMSCDGEVLFRTNADISLAFFIVNYLIPRYPELDFCVLVNRFLRVELDTEGIVDKTRLVGYQVVAKRKDDESKKVFCFVLMKKEDKKQVNDPELSKLANLKDMSFHHRSILGFYPVETSRMFKEDDEELFKTQFSEGCFPFELLSPV